MCIEQRIWLLAVKKARVVPIFKPGSNCAIVKYRPIALISNISSLLEKVIHKRLNGFIRKLNILDPYQCTITKIVGTAAHHKHLQQHLSNLFRFNKDTINHDILLAKIKS